MDKRMQALWVEFEGKLKRFILKRVGDAQAAEDILQDVFIKIHLHLESLQDDEKLESWVYQITRNAIIDYYRRSATTVPLEADLPQTEQDDDEVQKELARSVRAMVDSLPEEYRTPLIMDAFEGLDQADIAARLGISHSGAKSRIQRARAKLRDLFFDCCHFEFDRRGGVIDYHPRANCCPQCGCAPAPRLTPA